MLIEFHRRALENHREIHVRFVNFFFHLNLTLQFSELDMDKGQRHQIGLLQWKLKDLCARQINGHAMLEMKIAILYVYAVFHHLQKSFL